MLLILSVLTDKQHNSVGCSGVKRHGFLRPLDNDCVAVHFAALLPYVCLPMIQALVFSYNCTPSLPPLWGEMIWCVVQVDSKKELERQVKVSCEAFIMAVTKLTVEPMLSFITKVTAVKVATSHSTAKRLREQVTPLDPTV